MKKYIVYLLVLYSVVLSQEKNLRHSVQNFSFFKDKIFYDFYIGKSGTDSTVFFYLYYQIPNTFLKYKLDSRNSLYKNSFEIGIVLYKKDKFYRDWYFEKELKEKDFYKTISKNYFYIDLCSLEVVLDTYKVKFQIRDLNSQNSFEKEFVINLQKYNLSKRLIGTFLFDLKVKDGGKAAFIPNVARLYNENQQQLYVEYDLFNIKPGNISVNYNIYKFEDTTLLYNKKKDFIVSDTENLHIIDSIIIKKIEAGRYKLEIEAFDINGKSSCFKVFTIQGAYLGIKLSYNEHVRLLSLIATSEELYKLKQAQGDKEKQEEAIEEFWRKRDPDPETLENSEREEFYRRVKYANEHFASGRYRYGWESDMGKIYIIYGEPDYIERHDYNVNGMPYQIWIYNRLNKRFIFVDRTGFGDYELYNGFIR